MTHKFDPKHLVFLNNPLRRIVNPPLKILRRIGLKAGDTFIDIGAGGGFYAFPAAKLVGSKGKVYALDSQPEMINVLSRKKSVLKKNNLEVILTTDSDLGIPDGIGSIALLSKVFHEVDNKKEMLLLIKKALNKKGKLAIIEFNKDGSTAFGPPAHERISEVELSGMLERAGFQNIVFSALGRSSYLATANL
ncbi:MAG: methyltransferase domain-containing protein [Candidatus Margulisbacteria bacterium]|nr:methyltransferase domain-containing protein [Candidatus Margulisiibacteriota bacterium]